MPRSIGVLATRYIWVGVVEGNTLGKVKVFPDPDDSIDLKSLRSDEIVARIRSLIAEVRDGQPVDSVGAGFPGIVKGGVIQESPNLGQLKGLHLEQELRAALRADGLDVPVATLNDADALAAG